MDKKRRDSSCSTDADETPTETTSGRTSSTLGIQTSRDRDDKDIKNNDGECVSEARPSKVARSSVSNVVAEVSSTGDAAEGPTAPATTASSCRTCDGDVLMGRGRQFRDHPGNIRLRIIVDVYRNAYEAGNREMKQSLTRAVVRIMKECGSQPGRFLNYDQALGGWFEVDDETARLKVSHSFRDAASLKTVGLIDFPVAKPLISDRIRNLYHPPRNNSSSNSESIAVAEDELPQIDTSRTDDAMATPGSSPLALPLAPTPFADSPGTRPVAKLKTAPNLSESECQRKHNTVLSRDEKEFIIGNFHEFHSASLANLSHDEKDFIVGLFRPNQHQPNDCERRLSGNPAFHAATSKAEEDDRKPEAKLTAKESSLSSTFSAKERDS